MKTKTTKNKGMKMTAADLRTVLENKKERYAKQQVRKEKLEQTMTNTLNDIEQLEYTLQQMELSETTPKKEVPGNQVESFFASAISVYEYCQQHTHHALNYVWFCLVIHSRYKIESHIHTRNGRVLSPYTILNYFKREHDLYLTCAR